VFCIVGAGAGPQAEATCPGLSEDPGLVVLAVSCLAGAQDGTTVLEWAAEHAAQLGADPGRLLVAGQGAGRQARIIAVPVLAGAVAAGALLATDSQPPNSPGPPAQQIVLTHTADPVSGVVMPGQWVSWSTGCRRGRDCPRG
jgi:alpha/beta hydrolase fold